MTSSGDTDLPPWATRFRATFERVTHHLEFSEGFMLLPVGLPDAVTAELLVRWLNGRGLACHHVTTNDADSPPSLLDRLLVAPDAATVTLLFVGKLIDWLPGALQLLNQQRDVLAHRHPRPLLWCGPSRFLDLTWRCAPDLWSVAAVPIRLATPTIQSSEPNATPRTVTPLVALKQLFLELYTSEELRRFMRHHSDARVADDLPGPDASAVQLVDAAVAALYRREPINRALFERLRSERPRHYARIDEVAQMWLGRRHLAADRQDEERSRSMLQAALSRSNQLVFIVGADVERLRETVEDSADEFRSPQRVRTVPLRAMHDKESAWSEPLSAAAKASLVTNPAEVTIIVDAEGQPLGELDHVQLNVIRTLIKQAGDAQARRRPLQLVIPMRGTRATAETTARSLYDAIRSAKLPVHIVELDAPKSS